MKKMKQYHTDWNRWNWPPEHSSFTESSDSSVRHFEHFMANKSTSFLSF